MPCADRDPAGVGEYDLGYSRRIALASALCGSAALLAAAAAPPSRAAIIEEEVADRVFRSAAASVVSVADFRRDGSGAEISEVGS